MDSMSLKTIRKQCAQWWQTPDPEWRQHRPIFTRLWSCLTYMNTHGVCINVTSRKSHHQLEHTTSPWWLMSLLGSRTCFMWVLLGSVDVGWVFYNLAQQKTAHTHPIMPSKMSINIRMKNMHLYYPQQIGKKDR